ncbi:hypothetical protein [Kitasatospora sp. NPDC002965]|uniref:hypothetical protein n=1 Tax=Kitasatospora sp. NPDC002965 TaxID=3154775 RepID=UPI0033A8D5A6
MKRIKKAAATAVAVMALAMGGAAGTAGTAHARSTGETLQCDYHNTEIRFLPTFGGPIKCGGKYTQPRYFTFHDGTFQVFAVGTDNAMWTRWLLPDGSISTWRSLGGVLDSGIRMGWHGEELIFDAVGTDGNWWRQIRYTSGAWSGWFKS